PAFRELARKLNTPLRAGKQHDVSGRRVRHSAAAIRLRYLDPTAFLHILVSEDPFCRREDGLHHRGGRDRFRSNACRAARKGSNWEGVIGAEGLRTPDLLTVYENLD